MGVSPAALVGNEDADDGGDGALVHVEAVTTVIESVTAAVAATAAADVLVVGRCGDVWLVG